MVRKAKKRVHRMPPLSLTDKLIYWFFFVLFVAATFILAILPFDLRSLIAFSDPAVIAVMDDGVVVLGLFPFITIFLIWFIPWYTWLNNRKPIFGLRNFKYGPPGWPREYPLFMKNKPYVWVNEKSKRNRKLCVAAVLVILLLSLIPFPLSLYGRDCLRNDGGVVQYNMLNTQTREYSPGQVKEVRLDAYSRRRRSSWYARITLVMDDGKSYSFTSSDFKAGAGDDPFWLTAMEELKNGYCLASIHYDGIDKLDKLAYYKDLNPEQTQALYRLFGQD